MQMTMSLKDIVSYRMLAKDRQDGTTVQDLRAKEVAEQKDEEDEEYDDDEHYGESEEQKEKHMKKKASGIQRPMPSTMQVKVHWHGFQFFFLASIDGFWNSKASEESQGEQAPLQPQVPRIRTRKKRCVVRQPVLSARLLNMHLEAIQKGHNAHRIVRWVEMTMGSMSVENCNAQKHQPSRHIMSMKPFVKKNGAPVCFFAGVNTFELHQPTTEPGDTPISSILEPWEGLAGHTRDAFSPETPVMLSQLGFLKDHIKDTGKLMICAFTRVGEVRAMDWVPFRRRMMYFKNLGKTDIGHNLIRRPTQEAIDREILVKLQRRVETLVGKSHMNGWFESVMEGFQARTVDEYNSMNVLAKQMQLAPLRWKMLRSGQPQAFQFQWHNLTRSNAAVASAAPPLHMTGASGIGLLPWRGGMFLMPKAEFVDAAGVARKARQRTAMVVDAKRDLLLEEKRRLQEKNMVQTGKDFHLQWQKSQTTPSASNLDAAISKVGPISPEGFAQAQTKIPGEEPLVPLSPGYLKKWCRNGRCKTRFVYFDDTLNSILWKTYEFDTKILGVLPLWKIQDVLIAETTPVIAKAANSPQLKLGLVFSVVADQRTLDLQAETAEQQIAWVRGLKAHFRNHVRSGAKEGSLPQELLKLTKSYPEKLRSSQSELKTSAEKLQAMAALGDSLQAAASSAQATELGRQACEKCGSGLVVGAVACRMCGNVPSATPNTGYVALDVKEELYEVSIS